MRWATRSTRSPTTDGHHACELQRTSLDYVVVKFPRFAFEKFPGADRTLGTQMKSVGETMGIGRTFAEAFLKAYRSRELDAGAATPWHALEEGPERRPPVLPQRELDQIRAALHGIGDVETLVARDSLGLKRVGLSDADIAVAAGRAEPRCGRDGATAASARCTAASTRAPQR